MNDLQKRTWAEISLPNIRHNYEAIRRSLPAGCRFLGVVKADAYGLSPMSALPLLVEALRHGHADAFWTEEGMDAVELLFDDHARANVWFDGEGLPCRAELVSDDVVVVSCEINNWSYSS